jgi:HNH endonuclease
LYGNEAYIITLHQLLLENRFNKEQEFSTKCQRETAGHSATFIDRMFEFYIEPFHQNYTTTGNSQTPPDSPPTSVGDMASPPDDLILSKGSFRKYVTKRDGVCIFCWGDLECEGAHIIAQKNDNPVAYDEASILFQAGLKQKHQVQNGMLLCSICHGQFDKLKRYVDVVDGKLVVKIVNTTNDEKDPGWQRVIRNINHSRSGREGDWTGIDNRRAAEAIGEMALYFECWHPCSHCFFSGGGTERGIRGYISI